MTPRTLIRDICARLIAPLVRRLAPDPKYFELWQAYGFHVTQVHYYQPLPDTRELNPFLWQRLSSTPGLDMREAKQLELLSVFASVYKAEYDEFPTGQQSKMMPYYLDNIAFEAVDAEM